MSKALEDNLSERERELERLARAAGYAEAIADVDAWLRAANRALLELRAPLAAKVPISNIYKLILDRLSKGEHVGATKWGANV